MTDISYIPIFEELSETAPLIYGTAAALVIAVAGEIYTYFKGKKEEYKPVKEGFVKKEIEAESPNNLIDETSLDKVVE